MENSEFCYEKVQRYVDILTDAGFKAVFGDERNKDVLVDLINVVLPEDRHVKDIAYSTTEIPGLTLANKSIRLDLRCTGDDGSVFIVELQCYHQHNFFKRCVEYAAKVYDSGSARGDAGNYGLPPVYFIGLMAKDAPVFDRSMRLSGRTGLCPSILSGKKSVSARIFRLHPEISESYPWNFFRFHRTSC